MMQDPNRTANIKNMTIILYLVSFSPAIYLLLLIMLDTVGLPQPTVTNPITTLLIPILLVLGVADIFINYRLLIPIAQKHYGPEALPLFMAALILNESLGIFGLLIGLLEIMVDGLPLNYPVVVGFILVSIALNLQVSRNAIPYLAGDVPIAHNMTVN